MAMKNMRAIQAAVLSVLPMATAAGLLAWQAAGRPGLRDVVTGASPERTLQYTGYRD